MLFKASCFKASLSTSQKKKTLLHFLPTCGSGSKQGFVSAYLRT
jgi:hypothetical protein